METEIPNVDITFVQALSNTEMSATFRLSNWPKEITNSMKIRILGFLNDQIPDMLKKIMYSHRKSCGLSST